MNRKKNFVALLGLGYWGKNIFRNLYELGLLHTACDSNLETLAIWKKNFPEINYVSSHTELLKIPDIKAVAIATPAVTHYELAKEFLLADKDIFVEKPLALTVKDGEELVILADKKKKIIMVGHILQYHPAVTKLKEFITGGELGKIRYIYSNRLNIGKLRTEENILWSFAPHDISVILMLLNDEPEKVLAFGCDSLNKGIFDTTLTTLEFKSGIKGHIFVSWLHPYKEQKLIIVGSEKMAVFDDVGKEKLFLYPHKIEWKDGKIPVAQKAEYQVVPIEEGEPLKQELRHFADCVTQRERPLTDGQEGLKVLKILESAQECLTSNSSNIPPRIPYPRSYYIHTSTCIDDEVTIGEGSKIWHFSHILKGSKIGKNCIIGQNVAIGPDVQIGDKCKIQNNVSVYKGVTLEEEVFCGPSCVFTNVYNPRAFVDRKQEFKNTIVKKGATIGANATIVCGITIGRYAMVGAGAVIRSDVPDYAIVAGVPAKQVGWTCRCGTTLKFLNNSAVCGYCQSEYCLADNRPSIIKEKIND